MIMAPDKIRFQDIVYLKLNKWQAKILKNINKKNSTWGVFKLIRKQEVTFFLCRATKAEKIEHAKMKPKTTKFPFFHYSG